MLVEHFVEIARHGYQFERFEDAWCAWADADAAIDWTEERLQDTVLELPRRRRDTPDADHETLCACAARSSPTFGTHFREWMDAKLAAGTPLDELTDFDPPDPDAVRGAHLRAEASPRRSENFLVERYASVHRGVLPPPVLVRALADLRNTYPRATLHDCDEGSDFNPVRLGQTALGSN